MTATREPAFHLRTEEAPRLPPPATMVGVQGWVIANLFSSVSNGILTIVAGALLLWIGWGIFNWALFSAVWTGDSREACAVEGAGACWPFVRVKFLQWIYGFYPIDQRWRVNICFILGAAALVPMLIPSAPYKKWNALFLLIAYPLITLILLTGGHFSMSAAAFLGMFIVLALVAALLPLLAFGIEEGIQRNRIGLGLAGIGVLAWLASFVMNFGALQTAFGSLPIGGLATAVFIGAGGVIGVVQLLGAADAAARAALRSWLIGAAVVLGIMLILKVNFGLESVETSQWGGLLVTLVVAITGIVASLPLGILLALGRRSNMPIVKLFSVVFIEVWRGVPLITVLFMASVMLPLFLPEGVNFDKLLRALIGVALFSSAYMAEVVRGGLQAIPKGQFEAAQALGLSFWKMMNLIVLPQALKIVIPGIVNSFISLFKDTTLVSIIGLYDILGIVITSSGDAKWASPQTGPTAYFAAAAMFWIFCFGMSRYSIFTERRLHTGHKR
ncbi:MAG: amino acid ABC transporter permease [Hyphomicrobiales bacterium]